MNEYHITGNLEHLCDIPTRYQPLFSRSISGKVSAREAIKAMCLQCMAYKTAEVRLCAVPTCPLYTLRPYNEGGKYDAKS